ncbi:MAG: HAMP domain-containing sensor histidine kinase [Candidatus Saccharibacteria bacterium]
MLSEGYAGKVNNRQANFLSVIENSANRMNELIHSLLNVTRLEAGNITVDVKPVDLNILCEEIIEALSRLADDKNISIKLTSNATSNVDTDPILLRELITNLLSNAIKYSPGGGKVQINIRMKDRVIISVKDNGFGIPDRAKNYVFSKFYRAKNAVKYDVSGTGIGLYLAKQIADRLQGDIWFDSKLGKGTTFYFSLPLVGSSKKQGRFKLEVP